MTTHKDQTVTEAALEIGHTRQWVLLLIKAGRVPDAVRDRRGMWLVPAPFEYLPATGRKGETA